MTNKKINGRSISKGYAAFKLLVNPNQEVINEVFPYYRG
jgi:hypothetical protein